MGEPVAKEDDTIVGQDKHWERPPPQIGPPQMETHSFSGPIKENLAAKVYADNHLVAVLGSSGRRDPEHHPNRYPFQTEPSHVGEIVDASEKVFAGGKRLARNNDTAKTCSDDHAQDNAHVVASGTVFSG